MRNALAAALALLPLSDATASPVPYWPEMDLVGQARYRLGPLAIYDAALYAPGRDFSWEQPFALTLSYHIGVSAEQIADVAVEEMARIAGASEEAFISMHGELAACFADVEAGDSITGVSIDAAAAAFFHNGEKRCDIASPNFRRDFFGIWLSENTRRPDITADLLGDTQ